MSEEQKVPTKDEVIAFLKEQVEVKTAQLELQKLNTELAVAKAEELKALAFIGQLTSPQQQPIAQSPEDDNMHHTITQEDLDNNPELAAEGVKVGDEILIPNNIPAQEQAPIKKLKKN
jgi:hypothetical protein